MGGENIELESSSEYLDKGKISFESDSSEAPNLPITTNKELWGWWILEFGSAAVSCVSLAVFLPLYLEEIAALGGHQALNNTACEFLTAAERDKATCFVDLFGSKVSPSSYVFILGALSVIFQAILFISIGSLADYGTYRKKLLSAFSIFGFTSSMLIFTSYTPKLYWLAGLLSILINMFYGCALVFYNAFLPLLVQSHPSLLQYKKDKQIDESDVLMFQKRDEIANSISTRGYALGYAGGVTCLIICAAVVFFQGDSVFYLSCGVFVSGLWWAIFFFLSIGKLNARPGSPLPKGENYILLSYKNLWNTLKKAKHLKHTFMFLISFFMYADGYSTISTVAILFGRVEMHMTSAQLLIIAVITPFAALVGNYSFLYFQRWMLLKSKQMLLMILILFALIPIYGLIGLASSTVGIHSIGEMYAIGIFYGFLLGAGQSYSRVMFSELIPPGFEAEFFSLYQITDKGSSWFGPLMVALISETTGNMRYSFIVLLFLLMLPIPILMNVDPIQGKKDALAYAAVTEKIHQTTTDRTEFEVLSIE